MLRTTSFGAVMITLAGFAIYARSIETPFFFDDIPGIQENTTIRSLWRLDQVLSPPANGPGVGSRPLVNLSLAINYAIGGLDPRGYHVANIALHVCAALTLWGLLRRTLARPTMPAGLKRDAPIIAFVVALLWTVHPLQSETVICVVQRTESLTSLLYLLTLYGFARAVESTQPRRWLAAALSACLAGMAAKETMVTAPVMALIYDRTFFAGTFREAWRRRKRWHLGFAATWIVLAGLVLAAGGQRGRTAGFGLEISPWEYLLTSGHAIVLYLKLSFWPEPLVVDYGEPVVRHLADAPGDLIIVALLVCASIVALFRWPRLGFCGAWFFGLLAPSSSIVPLVTQTIAEHRVYLPLAAVIMLAGATLYQVGRRMAMATAICSATVLAALTVARNGDFASGYTIWQDTVNKRPDNARAYLSLGMMFFEDGRLEDAEPHFRRALEIVPYYAEVHLALGMTLNRLNRPAEAVANFQSALRKNPRKAEAHGSLGLSLLMCGRVDEALPHFENAVRLRPNYGDAEGNWGGALLQLGRAEDAVPHFERAVELQPDLPEAHFNLGFALEKLGRFAAAEPHYAEAVRLKPDDLEFRFNLGHAMLRAGKSKEALPALEFVVNQAPDAPDARLVLGHALADLGRTSEAITHFEVAQRLDPKSDEARRMLERLRAGPH